MRAIGTEAKTLMEIEESWAIVLGFPTDADLSKGQIVKLQEDGSVALCDASTDRPIGHIASGWKGNDEGNVRVMTPFVAHYINAVSDGVTANGALVACSGHVADGRPKFKAAVAGDHAIGVVTRGGADLGSISVGLLRIAEKVA